MRVWRTGAADPERDGAASMAATHAPARCRNARRLIAYLPRARYSTITRLIVLIPTGMEESSARKVGV